MPKRRRYSETDVATALAYVEIAPSVKAAAEDLNLPVVTLHNWTNGKVASMPDSTTLETAKKDLAQRFESIAHKALDLAPDKMGDASFAQLMTGVGIATDKMLLLRGEATSISSNMTQDEADKRVLTLMQTAIERNKQQAQAQDVAFVADQDVVLPSPSESE